MKVLSPLVKVNRPLVDKSANCVRPDSWLLQLTWLFCTHVKKFLVDYHILWKIYVLNLCDAFESQFHMVIFKVKVNQPFFSFYSTNQRYGCLMQICWSIFLSVAGYRTGNIELRQFKAEWFMRDCVIDMQNQT